MIKYYLTPKAIRAGCKFEQPRHGDAGYDIYSAVRQELHPHDAMWIYTGLYVEIPSTGLYSRVGLIRDRSGMAGIGIHTHAGVVDSSYRGEVRVLLENTSMNISRAINPGDKIAQMIIVQHLHWPTTKVDCVRDLAQTERGSDGFGSTGK